MKPEDVVITQMPWISGARVDFYGFHPVMCDVVVECDQMAEGLQQVFDGMRAIAAENGCNAVVSAEFAIDPFGEQCRIHGQGNMHRVVPLFEGADADVLVL